MTSLLQHDTITLITNAPASYDYPQNREASVENGARFLTCPVLTLHFQIRRNHSGLYWATTDRDQAVRLRRSFPYVPAEAD
jgi:hypothetical protein